MAENIRSANSFVYLFSLFFRIGRVLPFGFWVAGWFDWLALTFVIRCLCLCRLFKNDIYNHLDFYFQRQSQFMHNTNRLSVHSLFTQHNFAWNRFLKRMKCAEPFWNWGGRFSNQNIFLNVCFARQQFSAQLKFDFRQRSCWLIICS